MTLEESRKVVATLMVTYSNYNPVDEELAAETWRDTVEGFTYSQISAGLKMYIRTNTSGFAPVPGQIIDILYNVAKPQELNEMEAWSLVKKAIGRSAYYAEEEFKKLPPIVQKAVGLPENLRAWALDESFAENVVMSNFQRAYKTELKRQKEVRKLPKDMRERIKKINDRSYLGEIDQKRQAVIDSVDERKQIEDRVKYKSTDGIPMPDRLKERCKKLLVEGS